MEIDRCAGSDSGMEHWRQWSREVAEAEGRRTWLFLGRVQGPSEEVSAVSLYSPEEEKILRITYQILQNKISKFERKLRKPFDLI